MSNFNVFNYLPKSKALPTGQVLEFPTNSNLKPEFNESMQRILALINQKRQIQLQYNENLAIDASNNAANYIRNSSNTPIFNSPNLGYDEQGIADTIGPQISSSATQVGFGYVYFNSALDNRIRLAFGFVDQ